MKSRANLGPAPRPGFIRAWRNDGTNAENELTTAETIPLEIPLQPARTSVVFPSAEIGGECTWDEEHGVGVLFERGKVTEVGPQDVVL